MKMKLKTKNMLLRAGMAMGLALLPCSASEKAQAVDESPAVQAAAQVAAQPVAQSAEQVRAGIARLRGKLLYKKSQIRKLEKSACTANASLQDKADSLEKERRASFTAAEPKLEALYAEQDALDAQIKKLTAENSKE